MGQNDLPTIDPAAAMKMMMLAVGRQVEAQFPGCNITIFVSEPGAAKAEKPLFNHVTTAERDDFLAVLRAYLAENQH